MKFVHFTINGTKIPIFMKYAYFPILLKSRFVANANWQKEPDWHVASQLLCKVTLSNKDYKRSLGKH